MRGDSLRRRADVNMRACGRPGNRPANGNERDALRGEITDQRLPFGAVWVYGDVDGLAVIETQLVVRYGLTDRAHGKRPCEFQTEESVNLGYIAERPAGGARIANHKTCRTIQPGPIRRSFGKLFRHVDLGHQIIDFGDPLRRLGDLALNFGQRALAIFKVAFGYHAE